MNFAAIYNFGKTTHIHGVLLVLVQEHFRHVGMGGGGSSSMASNLISHIVLNPRDM